MDALFKRAGVPASTLWRWETGKVKQPHPITLQRIMDALSEIESEFAA